MLDGVLSLISSARVGFIGIYRDEETLQPIEYYVKLPEDLAERDVILLDPMLATGNSTAAAIDAREGGGRAVGDAVAIIAAPEGIERITRDHPDVQIVCAAIDRGLNEQRLHRARPRRRRRPALRDEVGAARSRHCSRRRAVADHLEVLWGALLAPRDRRLLTPAVGGMARLLGVVDRPEAGGASNRAGAAARRDRALLRDLRAGARVPRLGRRPAGSCSAPRSRRRSARSTTSAACAGGRSSPVRSPPRRSRPASGSGSPVHVPDPRHPRPAEWVGMPLTIALDRRDHEHGQLPRRPRRPRRRRLRRSRRSRSR